MGSLKQALKGLSVEFALLADKAAQQGKQEENDVVEKLNLFLDLLQSYKDLCERHEKGVLQAPACPTQVQPDEEADDERCCAEPGA